MGKKFTSAKCRKCGKVFLLGVNGSGANDGGDLCDKCAHNVRNYQRNNNLVKSEGERMGPAVKRRREG